MKKQNIFLGLILGIAPIVLCASVLAANKPSYNLIFADNKQPSSITVDINDTTINVSNSPVVFKGWCESGLWRW